MLTRIISILCLIALRVAAYDEIIPTQTLDLESRDDSSCQRYHGEVRVNGRRIGFLSFNSEDSAGVTRDKRAATLLHTDSNGRPRAGKSFIGTRRSAKGYNSLKSLPKKKGAQSELGGNLCYSSKTRTIYSGSTPQRLECKPITITPSCIKHQHQPNPSDGAYPKNAHRDEDGIPAAPSAKRSVQFNSAWEAMRAAL